jgi:ribulose-5-phosphate 4-epimerase/fuculose-1-phosphate aldolase
VAREVARATRALAVAGLFDMHGHISVRDGDLAYINSRRASRIAVRPEEIAIVRIADGRAEAGEPPSETPLHLAVYRARADAGSVAHFHPLYATAFAVAGRPLVTAFNAGAIFGDQVPVFDDPDLIQQDDQARAMAEALGSRRAVLLRGHGVAVCAEDLPSCVTASLYLEENARRLHAAYGLGTPRPYTTEELARVRASLWRPFVIEKTWIDALERARRAGVLADLE